MSVEFGLPFRRFANLELPTRHCKAFDYIQLVKNFLQGVALKEFFSCIFFVI